MLEAHYADDDTPQPQKTRAYVFTLNNWTEEEYQNIITKLNYQYIAIGDEIAPETGTPHLQGYIYFARETSRNTIKKAIPRAWYRRAKGTANQNLKYVSKTLLKYEDGVKPEQGKRKDIDEIKQYIKTTPNPNMRDIIENCATSYQGIKTAEVLLKYLEPPRDPRHPPTILWYYGDTGTGKTRHAYENYPQAYFKETGHKWWCGYDQHETVIIDDMRFDTFPWATLLRITDRYPNQVECKNGNRQLTAKTIIITSPYSPHEMFEGKITENIGQFIRRITEIKIFT